MNYLCPACGQVGGYVKGETVRSLVSEDLQSRVVAERYSLCSNPDCEVVYYTPDDTNIFTTPNLRVPVWFKTGAKPRYICYCAKVTQEDIDKAVAKGASTLGEVLEITGGMQDCNCKRENPTGKCCKPVFYEAVWAALQKKKNQR